MLHISSCMYDYLDRIVSLTDASGTRNFTYNAQHQLVNETIPHIMNLQSSFTYDNFGRRTLRTLQLNNTTIASAGRSYDTFGRIASISNGTDTLSYTYRPGGQLSLSGWTNGQNSAMSNQSYEYDQYNRLISIKLNNVNEVSYTLNARDQRTAATYANAGLWNFTYDDKGQVTGANGSSKSYAYSYDGIGNRLTANENSTVTNYTSNLLNQYTLINNAVPNYDADGNMTSSGNGWVYTYNGENRITQATKGSTSVTMVYDYAGRRISKTVSVSGVVQNAYKYVYDGFKLIAVYNNNDLVMTFTWQPESLGMDVPVSMTYGGATYYYVTDGNKNVTALLDASGNRVAEYVYGPFGQTVRSTGSMAQINPFRFSSEFHDDETGLVYYNYRYYSPELGRWTKRDPIEENGGSNLYSNTNNFIKHYDQNGLILIAFDGTRNTESDYTNVYLMYLAYLNKKAYVKGIGNSIENSFLKGYYKAAIATEGMMQAKINEGIDRLDAIMNDSPDTCLDVIGFSRGGILAMDFVNKVKQNKKYNKIKIRFVGLFDPVRGNEHTDYLYEANRNIQSLAIAYSANERRILFKPRYYKTANETISYIRYFAGVHSDVGGGYKNRGLALNSLYAMMERGKKAGAPFSYELLNIYLILGDFFGKFSLKPQFHKEEHLLKWTDEERELKPNIKFNDDIERINYFLYNLYLRENSNAFKHND